MFRFDKAIILCTNPSLTFSAAPNTVAITMVSSSLVNLVAMTCARLSEVLTVSLPSRDITRKDLSDAGPNLVCPRAGINPSIGIFAGSTQTSFVDSNSSQNLFVLQLPVGTSSVS